MSVSSDSDDENNKFVFDPVESDIPTCLGIDSQFCKLIFEIKQTLYSDIMYNGQADTEEAQDLKLNTQYESLLGTIHQLLMGLFKNRQQTPQEIPNDILMKFPDNTRAKLVELYNQCYQQSNNSDRTQREQYKLLVNNMFHVYIYDMGTR
jgi:hypothetical protein